MRKYIALTCLCIISSCTIISDNLTKELSGKKVYVCHEDYGLTIGEKTIQNITDYNGISAKFLIHLINKSGNEEVAFWHYDNNYKTEIQRDLINYPFCTKTQYEELKRKKEAKRQANLDRIKKEKEIQAKDKSDCVQAIEKAKERKNELEMSEGSLVILDETITTKGADKTSNWSFCFKVVDYDNNGVIVESRCTFSPVANILLGAFVGCEEKNYFIYTSDDYADGECYKNWQYLHKDAGIYNWNGKRIRTYKKTNHKISEIEYKTYLHNKELQCCINNDKIGVCKNKGDFL